MNVKKKPLSKKRRGRVAATKVGDKPEGASTKRRLRTVHIGQGVPSIPEMNFELLTMTDILLGREDAPISHGVMSLMEVADAYYARAAELTMLLQAAEREGTIVRNSAHQKFRTGELRTFMEMAKRAADLGSRRLTDEQMELERQALGRESAGRGRG